MDEAQPVSATYTMSTKPAYHYFTSRHQCSLQLGRCAEFSFIECPAVVTITHSGPHPELEHGLNLRPTHAAHNLKLYTRTHGDLLAIAFHPDGTRLLAVQRSGKITLYDMRKAARKDGGPAVAIKERPLPYDINDAQFSPDGTVIIAAYGVTVGNRMVGGLCILSVSPPSPIQALWPRGVVGAPRSDASDALPAWR